MKSHQKRILLILAVLIVAIAVIFIGIYYYQYVATRMYEDNANHLKEVYSQVDHYFLTFLNQNWGNLGDWNQNIRLESLSGAIYYLNDRRHTWGFTNFYFISTDGRYITPEGETGVFEMGEERQQLNAGQKVMFNATSPTSQAVTVFAIPVAAGKWKDFDYTSIGISYTNADIIKSLNVDAFSNKSVCFIVEPNGNVLISTQPGGSIYGNYLTYLQGASNLTQTQLDQLKMDWRIGKTEVLPCSFGKEDYYLYYQKLGYQNDILIGVVPVWAASANMRIIQRATINVLVLMFLLIGGIIIAFLIVTYKEKNRLDKAELKYRQRMFDILSMNINDIFIMLDANTLKINYLSPNIERLLGIKENDAIKNIRLISSNEVDTENIDFREEFSKIPMHGNIQWEREHINNTTGERRWFREFVYHENIDNTEKYIIVLSDRTLEKNMNQHLEELWDTAKKANKAKSDFLANMSHDIRTPMNAIIGFSGLIEKEPDNPDKVKTYIKKISASGSHLLSLINDVLDMSKIESGKVSINKEEFNLPEVLENIYNTVLPLAQAKEQTFQLKIHGHPTENLLGDKLRLNQILYNLLSNAIKYTQNKGIISLSINQEEYPSSHFAQFRFVVKDNGIGMSENFLNDLFKPFTREKQSTINKIQGTGLGMAITKNLVDLMDGNIDVKSEPNKGSTFTVTLKFTKAKTKNQSEFLKEKGISRILLADDENEVCKSIHEIFSDTDTKVTCVLSGQEAIIKLKDAKKANKPFDIIILDWKMPSQDGIETARQIRDEIDKNLPIILLTAYDKSGIEDIAREAGVDAFLSKPFFMSSFSQVIDGITDTKAKVLESTNENTLEGLRFLVAEDNDINYEVLYDTLNIEGALLERALNGKEAVEKFESSKPGYYDMILMDVQMPVMNGYEATRTIRSSQHPCASTIPIIAMTANAFSEDVREALNSGMNAHLAKPIYADAMIALIDKFKKSKPEN